MLLKKHAPKSKFGRSLLLVAMAIAADPAAARGVSPYLPLNLEPEIERQIERVLILADKPVMTRPIAAATVLDALPKACEVDAALCRRVEAYLQRYMRRSGVTRLRGELALTTGDSARTIPNAHGMSVDSAWEVSAAAYYQPSDYLSFNVGGVAYDGEVTPTGTLVSLGWDKAQLDVGYRNHWFSPFTDSSKLISTQAPTMPSVTLSNYMPFRLLGFQYEVFLAEMSKSDRIAWQGGYTSGKPRLAGLHLQIEPVAGFALSANRVMQFGGGARGGQSFTDFIKALYKPQRYDNTNESLNTDEEFGNQTAALTSRLLFPGRTPFAVYFEYTGEDNSYNKNFRLGNVSLSMGLDFPLLWDRFDFTYETTDWQNWDLHHVYQDGMVNEGHVIGHWFGDERSRLDGAGGQSHMLRLGWRPGSKGYAQARYRTLQNESYSTVRYQRLHELGLSYSWNWNSQLVGAELSGGRDVFGDSYARLAASLSFAQGWWDVATSVEQTSLEDQNLVELFVDAGVQTSHIDYYAGDVSQFLDNGERNPNAWRDLGSESGVHLGIGARRKVTDHGDLGVRLELDRIAGRNLLSVRALDYRYRFGRHFAISGFLGAGRYDLATPAYGYYGGIGVQWRDLLPRFDLNLDGRYYDKVARDKLLASDRNSPGQPHNDEFFDVDGVALYASYRF